ncbi:hypothetical protein DBR11_26720, partial [Pedobacter sp. HMWF019]
MEIGRPFDTEYLDSKSKVQYSISKKSIINFLFLTIVFVVTRQVPFSFLSPIMNLAVILIIVLSLLEIKPRKDVVCLVLLLLLFPLTYSLLYSIVATDNKIPLALKFYTVLVTLGLAYFVRVNLATLKWFVRICLLQVSIMVG